MHGGWLFQCPSWVSGFCNFPYKLTPNNLIRYSISVYSDTIYVSITFLNETANTTWKINVVSPILLSSGRSCINKTTQDIQKYVELSMGDCRSMSTQNWSLSPLLRALSSQPDDTSIMASESPAAATDAKCLLVLILQNRIPDSPPSHLVYPLILWLVPKCEEIRIINKN